MLKVEAQPTHTRGKGFDFRECPLLKAVVRIGMGEHYILFSDGVRHLQLAISGVDLFAGPLTLHCTLCGLAEFEIKSVLLRRLSSLYRDRRFLRRLYPVERRAQRWTAMLRSWDGMEAGATQRDIAAVLFGQKAATKDWDAGYRTRVQRLVRGARKMVEGGYLKLLAKDGGGEGNGTGWSGDD